MIIEPKSTVFKPLTVTIETPAEAAILLALIGPTNSAQRERMARSHPDSVPASDAFQGLYQALNDALKGRA